MGTGSSSSADPVKCIVPQVLEEVDAARYAGPALHLSRGLVKGTWLVFEPVHWYRNLPRTETRTDQELLHALCIASQGLEKIARDRGDINVAARPLATGSYGTVLAVEDGGDVVVKVFGEWEREAFCLQACSFAVEAARLGVGPPVHGYGWLRRKKPNERSMLMLFMEERLTVQPAGPKAQAVPSGLCGWAPGADHMYKQTVREIVQLARVWTERVGFHNDLKVDNILFNGRHPTLIDFDLTDAWNIRIAVSSSFINYNFRPFFEETFGDEEVRARMLVAFRCYYDLFCLTLSLSARHPWIPALLSELTSLFRMLEAPVFQPFLETEKWVTAKKRKELPFEVLVRAGGCEAVTCNLFDLKGNGYAHELPEGSWQALPSLIKSHGVYWRDGTDPQRSEDVS